MNQELKQIMAENDKPEFTVKPVQAKRKGRAKRYAALLTIITIVGLSFYATYKVNQFFEGNKLVFRTPIQSPVLIVKREIQTSQAQAEVVIDPKELSEKDLILSQTHGDLIWRVYGLESNFGKLDNCRKSGMFNGFGFKQHSKNWICYTSFAEVVSDVNDWFTQQLKTKSIPEALCFYNTGNQIKNCDYYQKYLNIKP